MNYSSKKLRLIATTFTFIEFAQEACGAASTGYAHLTGWASASSFCGTFVGESFQGALEVATDEHKDKTVDNCSGETCLAGEEDAFGAGGEGQKNTWGEQHEQCKYVEVVHSTVSLRLFSLYL